MAVKDPQRLQMQLFDLLQSILPENISMVDALAELLGVSNDSVYRRLRAETAITIEEVAAICRQYNISFDYLAHLGDSHSVSFAYKPLKTVDDYLRYLVSIRDDMVRIKQAKNKRIIYAAEDVPLFHNFRTPELTAFKVFYWLNAVVNVDGLKGNKYDPGLISDEILNVCNEIYNLYTCIPSIEIWSDVTPSSLLMQIDYFWQAGFFESNKEALKICDIACEEFKRIQTEAETGCKTSADGTPGTEENFTLYQSDIEVGNNTILVSIENQKALYLTHNTLNKIVTYNQAFCEETEEWLNVIIKKSTPLSGVSEKQRHRFFKKILMRLEAIRTSIAQDIT